MTPLDTLPLLRPKAETGRAPAGDESGPRAAPGFEAMLEALEPRPAPANASAGSDEAGDAPLPGPAESRPAESRPASPHADDADDTLRDLMALTAPVFAPPQSLPPETALSAVVQRAAARAGVPVAETPASTPRIAIVGIETHFAPVRPLAVPGAEAVRSSGSPAPVPGHTHRPATTAGPMPGAHPSSSLAETRSGEPAMSGGNDRTAASEAAPQLPANRPVETATMPPAGRRAATTEPRSGASAPEARSALAASQSRAGPDASAEAFAVSVPAARQTAPTGAAGAEAAVAAPPVEPPRRTEAPGAARAAPMSDVLPDAPSAEAPVEFRPEATAFRPAEASPPAPPAGAAEPAAALRPQGSARPDTSDAPRSVDEAGAAREADPSADGTSQAVPGTNAVTSPPAVNAAAHRMLAADGRQDTARAGTSGPVDVPAPGSGSNRENVADAPGSERARRTASAPPAEAAPSPQAFASDAPQPAVQAIAHRGATGLTSAPAASSAVTVGAVRADDGAVAPARSEPGVAPLRAEQAVGLSPARIAPSPASARNTDGAFDAAAIPEPAETSVAAVAAPVTPIGHPMPASPLRQIVDAVSAQVPAAPPSMPGRTALPAEAGPLRILTLQLHPADLGTVLVRMRLQDGRLEMNLRTGREETAERLRREGGALSDLLREAGYAPQSLTIEAGGAVSGNAAERGAPQNFSAGAQSGQPGGASPDQPPGRRPSREGHEAAPRAQEQDHDSASHARDRRDLYL